MSVGEDVGCTTDKVRHGANLAAAAGDAADEIGFRVARIVVLDVAGFGGADDAGRLADEFALFLDHVAGAARVQTRHTDLALRAADVAAEGDQLVAVTTGLAAAVPVGGS